MSSFEAPSLSEQNNAFDGWYHHQLTPETATGSNAAGNQQQHQQQRQTTSLQPPPQIAPIIMHPMTAAAAASLPRPPTLLPEGWEEMRDPHSGRMYYVDHERQITTWDRPSLAPVDNNHGNDHDRYYSTNNEGKGGGGNDSGGEREMATEATPRVPPLDQNYESQRNPQPEDANEDDWDVRMKELREFKSARGHTNVSRDHDIELGEFVNRQRMNYLTRAEDEIDGKKNCLTDNRIRDLKELGFDFKSVPIVGGGESRGVRQYSEKWGRTIEELKAYKEVHGHLNVPQKEGSLGRWVNNQRQFYSKRAKGEKTSLTAERVKELDEMGFAWVLKSRSHATVKKPPRKKPKHADVEPVQFSDLKSKKGNTSSSDATVSTKVLPDGSQVVDSKEKVMHCDGSTTQTATEETIRKRTIRLADGTRVLETTTKIVATKVERVVLPPSFLPETTETATVKKDGEEAQSSSKSEELQLPVLEAPQPESVTAAVESAPKALESPKKLTTANEEEDPTDSVSYTTNDEEDGTVAQTVEI